MNDDNWDPIRSDNQPIIGRRIHRSIHASCLHTHPRLSSQVATESISKELHGVFNYALVWGRSTKYDPQRCGFQHEVRRG